MKIEKDPASRLWTLSSGSHVLYTGRRSPWEQPSVMRDAARRERTLAARPVDGRGDDARRH
jgi:hypothetical protein